MEVSQKVPCFWQHAAVPVIMPKTKSLIGGIKTPETILENRHAPSTVCGGRVI
jgi:hypothetical protein